MRLGYDLTIEQTQKLVMTPELIQAIQILQFTTQELETYVEEQLLTNPILEPQKAPEQPDENREERESREERDGEYEKKQEGLDSEFDWAEHFKEREYDDISYRQEYIPDKPEYHFEQFTSQDVTLTEHLLFQLQFADMKPACRRAARYLVEALDENGYLTVTVEEAAVQLGVSESLVLLALDAVQSLEPTGVGARDLRECLLLQLTAMGENTPEVRAIVESHLEDIAANRLQSIARAVNISVAEVQEIGDLIRSLEPKPGRQYGSGGGNRYIVPDVTVEKVDGEYVVLVNESSAPRLGISPEYRKMLREADKDSHLSQFLTGRLNSALWLIKSIEQRRQTIYNVVTAVVNYQKEFFEQGRQHLKPLTLKQIAEEVGIHESTVSRSVNGKYMQTPRGVFEIKFFFTSGVSGGEGGVSSESVKSMLQELVDSEDPKAPYSDQAMVELLAEKGVELSRRTVAKYRDEMGVPSSSKRKRF
ncbi:MAG: RNA polymerase factor sigma-54 [Bacillota bacterium]|nr:RNA polymerase factor sigma-54 [Bacillota bacterium]